MAKITETTPVPVERMFNVELNYTELALLTLLLGEYSGTTVQSIIDGMGVYDSHIAHVKNRTKDENYDTFDGLFNALYGGVTSA